MSKINLNDTTSGYNVATINNNFQVIANHLNNLVLYRNNPVGEPNTMERTNLDMNNNDILNVRNLSISGAFLYKGQDFNTLISSIESFIEEAEKVIRGEVEDAEKAAATAEEAARRANDAALRAEDIANIGLPVYFATGDPNNMLVTNFAQDLPLKNGQPIWISVPGLNTVQNPRVELKKATGNSYVYEIVKGINTALVTGDLTEKMLFQYNAALNKLVVLNPTTISDEQQVAVPIGGGMYWFGETPPSDFLFLRGQPIYRPNMPEFFDIMYCGDANNETAAYGFRTIDDIVGSTRSTTGDYLWLPNTDGQFLVGANVLSYQYETFGIEDTTGALSSIPVKWVVKYQNGISVQNGVDVVALKAKVDGMDAIIQGISNGTSLPTGSIVPWCGNVDSIPTGFMSINTATLQVLPVSQYPTFTNIVWCRQEYNDTADFFYRCNNIDGSGRSVTGQYIVLPMASKYVVKGRDATGNEHPYQYQKGEPVMSVTDDPLSFPILWIIKVFEGVETNPSMLDIQEMIAAANNNSVPLGMIAGFQRQTAPPGWLNINYDTPTFVLWETFPQFSQIYYCGDARNSSAEWGYRCDDASGLVRNINGRYLCIAGVGTRFLRGRDLDDETNWYQYQDWAIENITGTTSGLVGGASARGAVNPFATGAFSASTVQTATTFGSIAYAGTALSCDYFDASRVVKTSNETRPKNIPVLWCIKVAGALTDTGLIVGSALAEQTQTLQKTLAGGEAGKILIKKSNTDFDATWTNMGQSGGIVQTNNASRSPTISESGKIFLFAGNGGYSSTLPPASTAIPGITTFHFQNVSSGVISILASPNDNLMTVTGINVPWITGTQRYLALHPSSCLTVTCLNSSSWIITNQSGIGEGQQLLGFGQAQRPANTWFHNQTGRTLFFSVHRTTNAVPQTYDDFWVGSGPSTASYLICQHGWVLPQATGGSITKGIQAIAPPNWYYCWRQNTSSALLTLNFYEITL